MRRIIIDPGKSGEVLGEASFAAVVVVLRLELFHHVHADDLWCRVPRRDDDLLVERFRDEDHVRARVVLRALVLILLKQVCAAWQNVPVILRSESSIRFGVDVAKVTCDRTA